MWKGCGGGIGIGVSYCIHGGRGGAHFHPGDWGVGGGGRNDRECRVVEELDDGWPESVEEQGLLLLVWRHNITNNILKMWYRQSRRGVSRQNSRSARQ